MLKDIRHEYAQLTQYGTEMVYKIALYKIVGSVCRWLRYAAALQNF
jgi:hypothetical protein